MFYNHHKQTAFQRTQQQPPRTSLEEIISQNVKNTQGQIDRLAKEVDEMQKRYEVCMKNLEVQMGQLSTNLANATRTGFLETTLDNPRNETCKMMEVERDEVKEIEPLTTESKVTEELEHTMKEWPNLRNVLQTKKVTKNSCCNNLLEYLFSYTGKPLFHKMVVVTKEGHKHHEDTSPKKKEDSGSFNVPLTIKGFYDGEVMCDLRSSANMMSLSLFNKIGGMEVKPCEARIGLVDGSLKNVEGVIETMDINIDGFTFPIEVIVMEIKGQKWSLKKKYVSVKTKDK